MRLFVVSRPIVFAAPHPPPLHARHKTRPPHHALDGEQSSILAQYILLLLTDYSIKGACNNDDQKFALEMVRQGYENKKNMSLYAVSKAMGFIPRHKLGHSFFRYDTCTRGWACFLVC